MASNSNKTKDTTPPKQGAATKPVETKSDSSATAGTQKFNPYKTSLCREYMETKKCRHGEYCLFAHGEKELKVYLWNLNSDFTMKCLQNTCP